MDNERKNLYTLISLEEFKAVLGIDDREEKTAKFCLVTSTCTIEQYCKRRFLKKQNFEVVKFCGDLLIPLREYPVKYILAAFLMSREQLAIYDGNVIEPEFYRVIQDGGSDIDLPSYLELSPAVARQSFKAIKVVYYAGYEPKNVPADLKAACMELASWNMNRYKGRRIGMSGNIKGAGIQGEHFELSIPENVKLLLEPYKRKTL
jgi:hypothetical protein